MKPILDFLITPVDGDRYKNTKKVGGIDLIVNTEMSNHQYVNREATILEVPLLTETTLKPGDKVLVHHNVFRRFYDVRAKEKNSRSYISDDKYLCAYDQIYMVDKGNGWESLPGYTFVQPIQNDNIWSNEKELPLWGIVAFPDKEMLNYYNVGDVVSFKPSSEFEFIVEDMKLYRIKSNNITVNVGSRTSKEAYNPSWTQSSR